MDVSQLSEGTLLRATCDTATSTDIKRSPLKKYNNGMKFPFVVLDKNEQVIYLGENERVQVGDLDDHPSEPTPCMYTVVRVLSLKGPIWVNQDDLEKVNE